MKREAMIFDLIKYELEFLLSNPEHLDDVADWIASKYLENLSDVFLQELWNIKINENN